MRTPLRVTYGCVLILLRARDRLCAVLRPFWELLAEHTGLQAFTLIGGCPAPNSGGEYLLAAVNYGMTKEIVPRDYFDFNQEKYKANVLKPYLGFLAAMQGESLFQQLDRCANVER